MKLLLKSSLMSEEVKFKIAHSNKNFIDLDDSVSSSGSDYGSSSVCESHHKIQPEEANMPESSRALN